MSWRSGKLGAILQFRMMGTDLVCNCRFDARVLRAPKMDVAATVSALIRSACLRPSPPKLKLSSQRMQPTLTCATRLRAVGAVLIPVTV